MIKKLVLVLFLFAPFLSYASDLNDVMKNYEQLHSAFFSYDSAKVELQATNLKKSIDQLADKDAKKKLEFASKQLMEIKISKDRMSNNKSFNIVSMALLHVIKNHGDGDKYKGYTCPMVKMQWIQNVEKDSQVMNPYASQMPHCGNRL